MKTWVKNLAGSGLLLSVMGAPVRAQVTVIARQLAHPESVVSDGRFLYVTNIGNKLDALAADGDGSITRLTPDGRLLDRNMAKVPLNSPKGIALVRNVLYVADLNRLVGLDSGTGKQVFTLNFSAAGVKLLNDLAVKNDSTLFATSTDLSKVFEVTLGSRPRFAALAVPEIKGANGLCYDEATQRLYVAGSGSFAAARGEGVVGCIEWEGGQPRYRTIGTAQGFFDGIALLDPDHLLVSDWVSLAQPLGELRRVTIATGATTLLLSSKFGGPADFYLTKNRQVLLVPATQTGALLRVVLPPAQKPVAGRKARLAKRKK